MPTHLHHNPISSTALLHSWSPNIPKNATDFYESFLNMDSASNASLISDHSSDCCIDEAIRKQLEAESIEVDMEGVVETTPENS